MESDVAASHPAAAASLEATGRTRRVIRVERDAELLVGEHEQERPVTRVELVRDLLEVQVLSSA